MEPNEIYLPMPFFFDRKTIPSLQEVVDSLQGFDAIAKRFPKILSALLEAPIKSVSVDVNRIEIGSLYDDLIVKFGFGGQEQMDFFMKEMHEKFMNHKAVPFFLFFALLIAGGIIAYNVVAPDEASSSAVINSNNTTIINMISADVGKDPDAVREIIERAIPRSDSIKLAKDSYKIFSAFADSSALKFKDFEQYELPKDVVDTFPSSLDFDSVQDLKAMEATDG